MSKDARECHTIPYYVTHVQFHPILCYIIFISLMRNVRSRKAKSGRKGGRGRGGGPRARKGVSYYHILSPKPPLSFQQQSIISLCRLGEKKGSVSNLQSSHQGNDRKIYRENSTFPET